VVFVNTVTLPHWVLAARLAGCRVMVHVHEAEEGVSRGLRAALYLPLLLAHSIIANSNTTRRVIGSAAARLRSRIRVIFNGVADPGAQPSTASIRGRLTVVSRLSPRKGVHDAVEALRLLVAAGRDLTLEICGTVFAGYEWYETELRAKVRAAGLDDRVIFAGFVSPIEDALARAEIVLAPSYGESFGNSVVEAMLAERPVVASAVQGLAEVVTDRRTGMLAAAGDAAAVAEAVAQLLDDPDQARRLAISARQEARSRFATERYGRALRDAVRDVLNDANQRKPQGFLKTEQIVAQEISSDANFAMLNSYRRPGTRPVLRVVGR
jgi:glycosyltransferase involved in cell wall biosynthesis